MDKLLTELQQVAKNMDELGSTMHQEEQVYKAELADRLAKGLQGDAAIGQYTGLKDKVGKKIFEGDIVEFTNLDLPNMVIRFDNGSFMLCEDKNSTYEELRMNYAVEVVGNIYEHPELIK